MSMNHLAFVFSNILTVKLKHNYNACFMFGKAYCSVFYQIIHIWLSNNLNYRSDNPNAQSYVIRNAKTLVSVSDNFRYSNQSQPKHCVLKITLNLLLVCDNMTFKILTCEGYNLQDGHSWIHKILWRNHP